MSDSWVASMSKNTFVCLSEVDIRDFLTREKSLAVARIDDRETICPLTDNNLKMFIGNIGTAVFLVDFLDFGNDVFPDSSKISTSKQVFRIDITFG